MSVIAALILGIVQGLTEFLPVSSSGHLVLFQKILGVEGDMLFFDTLLHVGTLVAVVVVLWSEILAILKNIFGKKTWLLVIATVPAVVVTLLFEDFITDSFEGQYLGIGFIITSLLLTGSELLFANRKVKKADVGYLEATGMGVMQAVAIFPGISRSGSTLAGGLAMGVERSAATKFSFLMTIPVILGSVVFQGYDLLKTGVGAAIPVIPTIVGVIAAAVSGFVAVKGMLKIMRSKKLYGFAIYTAILGVLVLLDQLVLHLVF